MLKSYIRTALRVLLKNKLYTIINIVGLSVAIACGIVAYLNYQFSQSFDAYHVNKERIYRLNSYKIINHQREDWAITPMPMAPALKENIAGVEDYTRIRRGIGIFRYEDKVFNEVFHYVDKDFFKIFTFPIKYGSPKDLLSNDGIVITERIAEKYFGNTNPVGKQISLTVNNRRFEFFINGVIKNPPLNSSLYISILIPIEKLKDITDADLSQWKTWSHTTFLLLKKNYPASAVEKNLQPYKEITNNSNINWEIAGFYLEPLSEVAFHSRDLRSNILMPNLHPAAIIGPSVVALLILLLACFNFLNTSIAFSGKRLNEIAVRKILGVKKFQLIIQFLGENFILCILAIIAGMMLAELFVPAYASLWPQLSFPVDFLNDWNVILFLLALLFFITFASGIYPAIYISRFESVNIFRNKQQLKGGNPLIRILLVFQFTLSITTIIVGLIFYKNAGFIKNYDMGFNTRKVIIVPVQNEDDYKLLKNKITDNSMISSISASRNIIGFGYNITEAKLGDLKTQVDYITVGENYLKSMGVKIVEGRYFNKNIKTDFDNSVLVNQEFTKKYGWTSIENKTIKLKDDGTEKTYQVIGMIKNYNTNGVWEKIQPLILRFSSGKDVHNLVINFIGKSPDKVFNYLHEEWKDLFPNLPFDAYYQSLIFDDASNVSDSISTVMFYVSLLALIISVMGMFALISLSVARRTKEIGIRKVLGASVWGIGGLISKEYIFIFIISSVISVFAGSYLAKIFISSIYAYYVEFGLQPFLFSILIVLFIAILTVGFQLYKAATSNPVDALRYE